MVEKIDLRTTPEGVTCEEYTLLAIAGPNSRDLPPAIQRRMGQHLRACGYHNSREFFESALGTPVTLKLEAAASQVIQKLEASS